MEGGGKGMAVMFEQRPKNKGKSGAEVWETGPPAEGTPGVKAG